MPLIWVRTLTLNAVAMTFYRDEQRMLKKESFVGQTKELGNISERGMTIRHLPSMLPKCVQQMFAEASRGPHT